MFKKLFQRKPPPEDDECFRLTQGAVCLDGLAEQVDLPPVKRMLLLILKTALDEQVSSIRLVRGTSDRCPVEFQRGESYEPVMEMPWNLWDDTLAALKELGQLKAPLSLGDTTHPLRVELPPDRGPIYLTLG